MSIFDKAAIIQLRDKLGLYSNKKILLTAIICLIIIYLDYAFIIRWQASSLKDLRVKITKLNLDLKAYEKESQNMQEIKNKQQGGQKGPLARIQKLVSEEEIAMLLGEISDIANRSEIKIIQIKPSREAQPRQEKNPLAGKFSPLLVSLDLTCGYHALGKFLNELEGARTFLSLQSLSVSNIGADFSRQKVNLVLKTYVRK